MWHQKELKVYEPGNGANHYTTEQPRCGQYKALKKCTVPLCKLLLLLPACSVSLCSDLRHSQFTANCPLSQFCSVQFLSQVSVSKVFIPYKQVTEMFWLFFVRSSLRNHVDLWQVFCPCCFGYSVLEPADACQCRNFKHQTKFHLKYFEI